MCELPEVLPAWHRSALLSGLTAEEARLLKRTLTLSRTASPYPSPKPSPKPDPWLRVSGAGGACRGLRGVRCARHRV